jgi:hypothetical protein
MHNDGMYRIQISPIKEGGALFGKISKSRYDGDSGGFFSILIVSFSHDFFVLLRLMKYVWVGSDAVD